MPQPVRALLVALALAAFAIPAAHPQVYPARSVRLIVPYPAGGGTDFFARTLAVQLSQQMGQQVVVENRPGAATIIGAEAAAKSAPDGYTLLLGDTATFAVNPGLYRKLPYDPQKDLSPISLTGRFALLLVVNPAAIKAGSAMELIDQAKKEPGKLDYASPGAGSPHHLAMELFKLRTGTALAHVPYKGAVPAIQDLIGGRIPLMFLDLAAGAPQIRAGKLKALAVASESRIPALPGLPTLHESGLPGFEAWAWQALAVPAGTPGNIVAKLNAEYRNAIGAPEIRQKMIDAGIDPLQSSPEEASAYIRSETAKWAKVIRESSITVE